MAGWMLAIAPLWLMLAAANTSACATGAQSGVRVTMGVSVEAEEAIAHQLLPSRETVL
jgi:hypothetical protein